MGYMNYEERLEVAKRLYELSNAEQKTALECIFPELCESEDEKVRKTLIRVLNENAGNGIEKYGAKLEEALVWLEKQGEHKKFRDSIQVGDEVTRNSDGVIVNLSQLNRVAKKDEKQSETFTKKDVDDAYVEGMALAKKELEKQGEQKSQRMISAEAKEAMYDKPTDLEVFINELSKQFPDVSFAKLSRIAVRVAKWAKPTDDEMKEALQTEYEKGRADAIAEMQKGWSDKEKIMYADIIEATKKSGVFKEAYKRELVDWLKSLRPQNTWKPSDAQMSALKIAANGCADQTVSQILSTLYKDLKKLTE